MIAAFQRRIVSTGNIPGALLLTKILKREDDMHVIPNERIVELLDNISPETYQEYVNQRQRQAYIYCRVNFAISGILKTVLMF